MKYRVKVELEWLKFLLKNKMVRLDKGEPLEAAPSDISIG